MTAELIHTSEVASDSIPPRGTDQADHKTSVEGVSIEAFAYQANVLIDHLTLIVGDSYPKQAHALRDILLAFATYIRDELWDLAQRAREPDDISEMKTRALALGRAVRKLHAFMRYLKTSTADQVPPAIQNSVTQLTDRFLAHNEDSSPLCLVRPQWEYNLEFVHLTWKLQELIAPQDLDPADKLKIESPAKILPILWDRYKKSPAVTGTDELHRKAPEQIAVLSFAGMDAYDTLLFPMLGHELGHFIDYSLDPPVHLQRLKSSYWSTLDSAEKALQIELNRDPDLGESQEVRTAVAKRAGVCVRELLADTLAIRMMGFGFFVALAESLKTFSVWDEAMVSPNGYPGITLRLKTAFEHLTQPGYAGNCEKLFQDNANRIPDADELCRYIEAWRKWTAVFDPPIPKGAIDILTEAAINKAIPEVSKVAAELIPDHQAVKLTERFFERIERLRLYLPPSFENEDENAFAEILSSAWAYQVLVGEGRESQTQELEGRFLEYSKLCRLTTKAIELIPVSNEAALPTSIPIGTIGASENGHAVQLSRSTGVLSGPSIVTRLRSPIQDKGHLDVVPLGKDAVGGCSIDLRLGNWFAFAKRTKLPTFNVNAALERRQLMSRGMEEFFVPHKGSAVLHPGDLVLGVTLEFVSLPHDLMAYVEGRSSLGRMGLFVATATKIDPGFRGVIVLELANAGTVPLVIETGTAVAQLVLQTLDKPLPPNSLYMGKYQCQIKPLL